ncbi:asparagine synthase (glutamine-hydrolyzing) [Candidatus Bathyarchaeota archaeon]|nr:MAG: asparagine synthase (glutamine-hydrolyzing) [Candidatus Bathyarchaeota archaeon]
MCGIVGIVESSGRPVNHSWLEAMNGAIRHRGPDDDGFYVNGAVGLGMRRLSIIDVEGGHQPIHNEDKTVWVVFNGEIYNFREIRESLEKRGHQFQTDSDTETLVHLYEEFGAEGISRLRGMFAYALWDENRERLILARDRIGIKPLYYSFAGGRLLFGSELKSFLAVPAFTPEINPSAIEAYLTYLYIPGPQTVFRGVTELPPAHYLVYEAGKLSLRRYWTIDYRGDHTFSTKEWEDRFLGLFRESVKSHLVSDVPLGAFLSGGIDSSAIVGIMAQESSKPIETFTVGHEGKGSFQDERAYARLIAERFGTHHHEFMVTPDIRDLLPKLVACFDQPFADSSAIPTYYISELTRRHVTVALSGLGGDEIGGGYERYLGMLWIERYRKLPRFLRQNLIKRLVSSLPDPESGKRWADRLKRFVHSAEMGSVASQYASLITTFSADERRLLLTHDFLEKAENSESPDELLDHLFSSQNADTILHHVMLADLRLYLPNDLLVLTDRVSMYHSLEVRVPFLDHPLVELMARIPTEYKISARGKKTLLRGAFRGLLPGAILNRKKLGFSVPLALWLRTDLQPMMREILSIDEIKRVGFLQYSKVERIINEHLSGRANHENKLWGLINLVYWYLSISR